MGNFFATLFLNLFYKHDYMQKHIAMVSLSIYEYIYLLTHRNMYVHIYAPVHIYQH